MLPFEDRIYLCWTGKAPSAACSCRNVGVDQLQFSLKLINKFTFYKEKSLIEVLHESRDPVATVTTPPSCMPGQNNMAAVEGDRVPSLRGYRDSLSSENRQMYDEKLKIIAGIDPYSVSANFFSQSMTEWSEIEFPDIVNYLL